MVIRDEARVIDRIGGYASNILFELWREERGYHRATCGVYTEGLDFRLFGLPESFLDPGLCTCKYPRQVRSTLLAGEEPARQRTMVTPGDTFCVGSIVKASDLNEYAQRTYPELELDK